MESSRIFIKGLPPTFSDDDFRKHFSSQFLVTDSKIFPSRRIGYIGYRTPEDARKAVKYYNKTFIRMSRVSVELARSVEESRALANGSRAAPTAIKTAANDVELGSGKKRTRDGEIKAHEEVDPKLKEFLAVMKPKSKKKAWEIEGMDEGQEQTNTEVNHVEQENASDDEYESVPKKAKRASPKPDIPIEATSQIDSEVPAAEEPLEEQLDGRSTNVSDADWARSRTSRLLGLLDDDEEDEEDGMRGETSRQGNSNDLEEMYDEGRTTAIGGKDSVIDESSPKNDAEEEEDPVETAGNERGNTVIGEVRETMRLYLRNLPFDVKEEDLEAEFESYGNLDEVHVAKDKKTGAGKGFAFLQFADPDSAENAYNERDGSTFQGRLLHILPAQAKRETLKLNDFELSKLPLKKQQLIKKRREFQASRFNWNALYMNADAVVSSVADRFGLAKSEVLDPTSSDAAVKQAMAETHVIQETKTYFKQHGVNLDAFKRSKRGDTAILVKNIPYDCSRDELKRRFEEHGDLKHFLMPPSGVIAIIEYANATQCSAAYSGLAYRKMKSSMLLLEKAPVDLFSGFKTATDDTATSQNAISKTSASDLKNAEMTVPNSAGISTLFVRNLNFSTSTTELTDTFQSLDGFLSARVKTKTDPKKPGQILSMGFGFLEFRSSAQAQAALAAMDGHVLAGHKLQIRASHKGADAAEDRRKADAAKRAGERTTKIIIKNLPFQATKKDVRALFGSYGQLRSVRVPKKMDNGARGFAFADFTTPKEAESAMDALKDTHLLGRRLVLDYAEAGSVDAEGEIEKMQQKVGAQVNKVALQKLTSGGRKKFSTAVEEEVAD